MNLIRFGINQLILWTLVSKFQMNYLIAKIITMGFVIILFQGRYLLKKEQYKEMVCKRQVLFSKGGADIFLDLIYFIYEITSY